jgi:magnesium transporter
MIATNTTTRLDLILPPVVRFHDMPAYAAPNRLNCSPALSFHQQTTAQQAIDALRQMQSDIDHVYYLFVTDAQERLVGVVSMRALICATPGARLFEFMDRQVISLSDDATLEEQAHVMSESGLLALPVVDEKGRLLGAMDASDLISAMQEESTAEMYHLAGIDKQEAPAHTPAATRGYRTFWLLANLGVVFLAALLISSFLGVFAHTPVLAALLPLAALLGGLAGRQTLTFVVRSLTLGQIDRTQTRRVLGRELAAGLANGLIVGGIAGAITWLWQGQAVLSLVVGVSVLLTLLLASLVGVAVPMLCKTLQLDHTRIPALVVPAVCSLGGVALLLGLSALVL